MARGSVTVMSVGEGVRIIPLDNGSDTVESVIQKSGFNTFGKGWTLDAKPVLDDEKVKDGQTLVISPNLKNN